MLKVGGIWVSPVEIEARLMEHERVFEVAVVGREDEDELVKPEAFVVLKEASEACDSLAEDLRAFCREGLARYKYPRWVSFVDELPTTATGKIQRYKMRGRKRPARVVRLPRTVAEIGRAPCRGRAWQSV